MTNKAKEQLNKTTKKCTCVPHGMCLRCFKMTSKAHSEGYNHAMKDLIKYISGKKPTDRFNDWKEKLKPYLKDIQMTNKAKEQLNKTTNKGKKETYELKVICHNCGEKWVEEIEKGLLFVEGAGGSKFSGNPVTAVSFFKDGYFWKREIVCPNCGCSNVGRLI
jgi:hypothetical protein